MSQKNRQKVVKIAKMAKIAKTSNAPCSEARRSRAKRSHYEILGRAISGNLCCRRMLVGSAQSSKN